MAILPYGSTNRFDDSLIRNRQASGQIIDPMAGFVQYTNQPSIATPQQMQSITMQPMQPVQAPTYSIAPQQPMQQITVDPMQPVQAPASPQMAPVWNPDGTVQQSFPQNMTRFEAAAPPPEYIPPQVVQDNISGQNGSILNSLNPSVQGAYNQTLQDTITGKIYDPMEAKTNEAMAQLERDKRAGVANQISQAGFTGQGIGQQIAAGTENALAQNRFNTMINTEVARNDARTHGMQEARGLAGQEEAKRQFDELDPMRKAQVSALEAATESTRLANKNEKAQQASGNFANYMATHLDLADMSPEDRMNDAGYKQAAQSLWEEFGGTGDVPAGWADFQYRAARDPRLTNSIVATNNEIDTAVSSGAITAEDGQDLKDIVKAGLMQFFKRNPETGKMELDVDALSKLSGGTTINNAVGTGGASGTAVNNTGWTGSSSGTQTGGSASKVPVNSDNYTTYAALMRTYGKEPVPQDQWDGTVPGVENGLNNSSLTRLATSLNNNELPEDPLDYKLLDNLAASKSDPSKVIQDINISGKDIRIFNPTKSEGENYGISRSITGVPEVSDWAKNHVGHPFQYDGKWYTLTGSGAKNVPGVGYVLEATDTTGKPVELLVMKERNSGRTGSSVR